MSDGPTVMHPLRKLNRQKADCSPDEIDCTDTDVNARRDFVSWLSFRFENVD